MPSGYGLLGAVVKLSSNFIVNVEMLWENSSSTNTILSLKLIH